MSNSPRNWPSMFASSMHRELRNCIWKIIGRGARRNGKNRPKNEKENSVIHHVALKEGALSVRVVRGLHTLRVATNAYTSP